MAPSVPVTTDESLVEAVRDIILDLDITPKTVLAEPIQPGDRQVMVPDDHLDRFNPGQLFTVYTDFGDETAPISQTWDKTNPVLLDFQFTDTPEGFMDPYLAGTVVGTNLFQFVPNNIDGMLWGEDPLIYIVILDESLSLLTGHQVVPIFTVHIELRRALVEPQPAGLTPGLLNTNLFTRKQQRRCREDMESISNAITNNPSLQTAAGDQCIDINDVTNPTKARFTKTWQKIIIDPQTQHFAGLADFTVMGFQRVFYSKSVMHP